MVQQIQTLDYNYGKTVKAVKQLTKVKNRQTNKETDRRTDRKIEGKSAKPEIVSKRIKMF